ncbi:MAG: hypothetical protein U0271_03860 [Polyangiaceae bacterium]
MKPSHHSGLLLASALAATSLLACAPASGLTPEAATPSTEAVPAPAPRQEAVATPSAEAPPPLPALVVEAALTPARASTPAPVTTPRWLVPARASECIAGTSGILRLKVGEGGGVQWSGWQSSSDALDGRCQREHLVQLPGADLYPPVTAFTPLFGVDW